MKSSKWPKLAFSILLLGGCQGAERSQGSSSSQTVSKATAVLTPTTSTESAPFEGSFGFQSAGLGLRLSCEGTNFSKDGTALNYYLDSRYQPDGEEKLVPLQGLFDAVVKVNGKRTRPSEGSDYKQILNVEDGSVTTSWRHDQTSLSLKVLPITAANSVKVEFLATPADNAMVEWVTDNSENCPVRYESLGNTLNIFPKEQPPVGSKEPILGSIDIEGPVEDAFIVRRMVRQLLDSVNPQSRQSIPPFGLTNDLYSGHIFWDADVWLLPVLALLSPERAQSLAEYRIDRSAMAQANFSEWLRDGRPTSKSPLGPAKQERPGMKFPWESSVSGKETVPGPSKFQHHISGSVLWSFHLMDQLGIFPGKFSDYAQPVSEFYRQRTERNDKSQGMIRSTMSPDENFIGDNDLYTNILAERAVQWGAPDAPNRIQYVRPRDEQSLLNYDNDRLKGYKQVAGLLAIFPLQDPEAEKQATIMMNRFADKVITNGPAMSEAIISTIWSRIGEPEKAYAAWREAWQPFTQHPHRDFSEKRRSARTTFITGMAGCLQSVLYGFAGMRIDEVPRPAAAYNIKLKRGYLSISPHLPKEWKKLGVTFKVDGNWKRLEITQDNVELKNLN